MADELKMLDLRMLFSANSIIRTYFEEASRYMFVMYNRLDQREDCYKLNQFKDQLRDSFDKYIRAFSQPDNDRRIDIGSFSADSWKIYLPVLTKTAKLCYKEKIPLDESSALEENENDELIGKESQQVILSLRNIVKITTDKFMKSSVDFLSYYLSIEEEGLKEMKEECKFICNDLVLHKSTVNKMIKKYLIVNQNPKQDINEISLAELYRIQDMLLYHKSLFIQATLCELIRLNRLKTINE